MAHEIIMPKAGMAMETGTIIRWLKNLGDKVEQGDIILEIETDKVSMEVEAESSGYLIAQLKNAGDTVPVTEVIGYLGEKGEQYTAESLEARDSVQAPITPSPEARKDDGQKLPFSQSDTQTVQQEGYQLEGEKVAASPAARRIAREMGVSLATIGRNHGTGAIRSSDILAFAKSAQTEASSAEKEPAISTPPRVSSIARKELEAQGLSPKTIEGSGSAGRVLRRDLAEQIPAIEAVVQGLGNFVAPIPVETPAEIASDIQPLSGIRKRTAQKMVTSQLTIPAATLHCEVDLNKVLLLRQEFKAENLPITINTLIIRSSALALRDCTWMQVALIRQTLADGSSALGIARLPSINIGIAVATDRGLLVPVIHNADSLDLLSLAHRTKDLTNRASRAKLTLDEMQGSSFSISNLGTHGITTFTPIINPPEAAILGVGSAREKLVRTASGEIGETKFMDLSLSFDHRIIDGAEAAMFLQKIRMYLETPLKMMVSA